MGRSLKFPLPKDYPAKDPIILCPADRIISIYNKANGSNRRSVAKGIIEWFKQQASDNGWADCRFVPAVQTKHSAGCILLNPLSVTVTVNQIVIRLPDK
jgi:hypothetical protein